MQLQVLDKKGIVPGIVLLQCPSSILSMFIEDKVKGILKSNQNTVFTIKSKKDFRDIRVICNVEPFQSRKWLYFIDLDKLQPDKEFFNLVKGSSTVCYFMTCSKYITYKRTKEAFKDYEGILDFYVTYLKSIDMSYLYNEFVYKTGKKEIFSKAMYQYVKEGYSGDVDAVATLFDFIKDYEEKEPITTTMVTELCGLGGNTLESFVFSLLKDAPKASEKSFKIILRKRFQAGVDLMESYQSWSQFGNYLNSVVYNIMCVKELLISNAVYKTIRNLPSGIDQNNKQPYGYNEKVLSRYNRYLWRIKEIPMSRVLRLKTLLVESRWNTATDFMYFLYRFYEAQVLSETLLR